ncbi:putative nucleotidyltransferase with HDIG domain [Clostridiales Family XIII bacterium PM5-7]
MRKNKRSNQAQFSILTVDDDPIMTTALQAYFQRSGYAVETENDPYQAIEKVANHHYDILLLDFLMSPICGDVVVEEIRKFNKELFIILLTGHKSMAPPIQSIRQLDIQGYYEKSDRFDQLELLVESCIKSIKQMRTIKDYQSGLSVIVEEMPEIYKLQKAEDFAEGILDHGLSIFGCNEGYIKYIENEQEIIIHKPMGKTIEEIANYYLIPFVDDQNQPLGELGLNLDEETVEQKKQLLQVFAKQVSAAMINSVLHDKLTDALEATEKGYIETLTTLRFMVDAKDKGTRGHSDRVAKNSELLARHMGLDEKHCELIRIAGQFHDIGKVGVPDRVLLKEDKLTDEEYEQIKKHPSIGSKILSGITELNSIVPMVRGHHERIDGNGYPDKLKGDEIPFEARIISIIDAFDAMTSTRPYREGMAVEQAISEIRRCAGTHFDAEIANIFCALVDEYGPEEFKSIFVNCEEN